MEDLNFKMRKIKVGDVIEGTVFQVKENEIILDINYFCEGTIYKNEYSKDPNISLIEEVKLGDTIKARVGKVTEEQVLLSRLPLLKQENFEGVKEIFKKREDIEVKVFKDVKGGLLAKYNEFDVFIPDAQIENETETVDKKSYLGKSFLVRITEIDFRTQRIVASRKNVQREEFYNERKNEFESIKVGDVLTGKVARIENYGAFVKFKYNQGLLRLPEISHVHIDKVSDALKVDDEITVKVINKNDTKLELSKKALMKTPYQLYAEDHKVSDTVKGEVIQKTDFGLILSLADNVTGLLHKSEFTWNPKDNFMSYIKLGDVIEAKIISLDTQKRKIGLSKKVLEDNPWKHLTVKKNDIVTGKVINVIASKGVEIEVQGVTAFVSINELAQEKVSRIEDVCDMGDEITGIVTELEKSEWVMNVSVRRHLNNVERKQFEKFMEENKQNEEEITLGDRFKNILKK